MSSQPSGGAGGSGDKPPGLTRFMRRASKVLKRGSSKRGSVSGLEEEPSGGTSTAPAEAIPEQPASPPKEAAKPAATGSEETAPPTETPFVPAAIQQSIRDLRPSTTKPAKTAAESSARQEEKARILFAKYGMTLGPDEWTRSVTSDAERIEKKVRMRIKRTCHRCQTTYGADKVCNNCQHRRCKKCPRYPTKRVKEVQQKDDKPQDKATAAAKKQKQEILSIMSRRTGQDMQFGPKIDKLAGGYSGDPEETFPKALRQRKKVRIRIRWKCHHCQEIFLAPEKICAKCGHERCGECPRDPLKKNKPPPDEELLRRVEERMRTMTLSPSASAA